MKNLVEPGVWLAAEVSMPAEGGVLKRVAGDARNGEMEEEEKWT